MPAYRFNVLKNTRDFNRVFRDGTKFSSRNMIAICLPSSDQKCGVAVSSKVRVAPKRNLAKRRLREILRNHLDLLPSHTTLVLFAKPGFDRERYCKLEEEYIELMKRVRHAF